MGSLPPKPKFGSPCNGCGLCCRLELCVLADVFYPGATAPCPGLKTSDDGTRTYCELVQIEQQQKMVPMIQLGLGVGLGCGMRDEDTDEKVYLQQIAAWTAQTQAKALPLRL